MGHPQLRKNLTTIFSNRSAPGAKQSHMLDEHTNQRNEFRVFGVEKFRGGFMIGLFSMMVGAIVYLFLNCGHEKRELQGEIKELRHELIACKDSSMAKIERLKDQHSITIT